MRIPEMGIGGVQVGRQAARGGGAEGPVDRVDLGVDRPVRMMAVTFPPKGAPTPRNAAPVVLVHGTRAEAVDIQDYHGAALQLGHASDLSTYPPVRDGRPIAESATMVTEKINEARVAVARRNLEAFEPLLRDPARLREAFEFDSGLSADPAAERIAGLLPEAVQGVRALVDAPEEERRSSFSTRARGLTERLAGKVAETGFGAAETPERRSMLCRKVALEIVETLAPRAILIGHSMGGFVAWSMVVNPQEPGGGRDFSSDGGNGVSLAVLLSSPIAKGLKHPLPPGLRDWPFDLLDRHLLTPLENMPPGSLIAQNPLTGPMYRFNKSVLKTVMGLQNQFWTALATPFLFAEHPGYPQVMEGSEFLREQLAGRPLPADVSAVSVTSPKDGVVEQHRSLAPDQPNAHNLDAEVVVTSEDLRRDPTRNEPILAHRRMTAFPLEHRAEFRAELMQNPKEAPRLLDPANADGLRWSTLAALQELDLSGARWGPTREAIARVAAEGLPFADSPSALAKRLLERF